MPDKSLEIIAELDHKLADVYDELKRTKKRKHLVAGILWLLLAALLWAADLILIFTEK